MVVKVIKSGYSFWVVMAALGVGLWAGVKVGGLRSSGGVVLEKGKDGMDYLVYHGWRIGVPRETSAERLARFRADRGAK